MAFGYVDGDKLILFTFRRDLGSGRGKRGSWWALIAFDAMADMREEIQYPLTKWIFPLEIKLAIERILNQRSANFELMSEKECEQRISEVMKAQEDEKRFRMQQFSGGRSTGIMINRWALVNQDGRRSNRRYWTMPWTTTAKKS